MFNQGWSSVWPLATNRSRVPSLSTSSATVPKPVMDRLGAARFAARRRVGEQAAAEVPAQGAALVDEVGVEQVDAAVTVEVLGHHSHAGRSARPAPVVSDSRGEADLLEPQPTAVAEQEVRRPVVGDEEVEPAIPVEIGDRQAQALAVRDLDPRLPADVGEGAVPIVAEEMIELRPGIDRDCSGSACRTYPDIRGRPRGRPRRRSTTTRSRSPSPSRSPKPAAVVQRRGGDAGPAVTSSNVPSPRLR